MTEKNVSCDIGDTSENIVALENMVQQFSELNDGEVSGGGPALFKTDSGTLMIFGLLKKEAIGVANAFMSNGCVIDTHVHDGYELLVVYQGKLTLEFPDNGEVVELDEGRFRYIKPGRVHSGFATGDTWVLMITIPVEKGIPHE